MSRLKVATYNIHRCMGLDGSYDPERVVEVIKNLDADVIGLQEIDSHSIFPEGHQLNYIVKSTHYHVVAGPTLYRRDSEYGNATLSRFPIKTVDRLDFSINGYEPRGALDTMIDFESKSIRVINTHFGLNYWERRKQVHALMEHIKRLGEQSCILLGDFNDWVPVFGATHPLRRTFHPSPVKRTFPSDRPLFPLDRIFIHRTGQIIQCDTLRDAKTRWASDHLPLWADIEI